MVHVLVCGLHECEQGNSCVAGVGLLSVVCLLLISASALSMVCPVLISASALSAKIFLAVCVSVCAVQVLQLVLALRHDRLTRVCCSMCLAITTKQTASALGMSCKTSIAIHASAMGHFSI